MVQVHGKQGVKGGNFSTYPPTPFNESITHYGLTMEVYVEWFLLIRTWYFQQTTLTNTQRVRNYGVDMRSQTYTAIVNIAESAIFNSISLFLLQLQ